jgi:hypothetical protein
MSDLKMRFYITPGGVEFGMSWDDETQFRDAIAFLDKLTGFRVEHPDGIAYYVLETEDHLEALYAFRREQRRPEK